MIFTPPNPISIRPRVFLAGSIEMGAAEPWQDEIAEKLDGIGADVYNPRRPDWDSSWEQHIFDRNFRGQVEWELAAMEAADVIAVYFDPATKSPITLMEVGLHSKSGKIVLCCPEGFWRRGNVQVMGNKYGFTVYNDKATWYRALVGRLESIQKVY